MPKRFFFSVRHPLVRHLSDFLFLLRFSQAVKPWDRTTNRRIFSHEGSWHAPMQKGLAQAPVAPEQLAQWWTVLNDPVLTDLITCAVQNNLDMKLALERIRQYRLLKGIKEAGQAAPPSMPRAGASWTGTSNEEGTGTTTKSYSTGLDASWEIDLFGRIQRAIEAADATLSAKQEALRDALVSLVADLADSYINVRTAQIRLNVVRQSIDSQTESFQLTQWQKPGRPDR